jgi:cell division protein FtsB
MDPREPPAASRKTPKGRRAFSRPHGALFLLFLLLALVLVLDSLIGDRGVFAVMQARREHADAESALKSALSQNARLRAEIDRLKADSAAIEELARRHLGLVKPGETLFIIKDVRKPSPPSR